MSRDLNLKISIITVSYNAAKTIEQTILSVVNQTYKNIEYIIIDGGSTDGTVDIIKKYTDKLAYWVSEPDDGMYDALVKGFEHITGDVCAYINADDFYQLYAFDIINEIFQNESIKWVTGINTQYNNKGQIVSVALPHRYRNRFILKAMYNGRLLHFIQQESTFWRSELLDKVDFDYLRTFHLAGDYCLWVSFAKSAKLDIVQSVLSGFRIGEEQLSDDMSAYLKELNTLSMGYVTLGDKILAVCDRICSLIPPRFRSHIINYNHFEHRWKYNG